ncbi:hypothetical protein BKA65DRAFT_204183 [Rhexocercosporidium sp. MPI-PUGE-AT-0058]|nr:hypothetical protein BKA65DRAFT_204183 [Rhexocercosporidium sp. MPI-PUGE-AT-0058]
MPQRSSMLLGDDKDLRHLIPPLGRSRMTSTGESASSHQPFYLDPLPTAYKDGNNHADPGQQGTVRRAPETSPEEESCKITTGDHGDYDEEYREIQPVQNTPISPADKDRWGPKLPDPFASSRHPSPIQDTSYQQPRDQEPIAMMDRLYVRQGTGGVLDIIDEELRYLPPSKFVGQFRRPRKNAAITIKRPDGTPIDLSNARVFTAPKPVEDNGRKITNAKYCSECNIQFRKAHRWLQHMERHVKVNGGQGIPCRVPGCGNTFFEEQELKDHELRHFTCTVEGCGRQFVSVKERREHHGTHVVETGGG